MTKPQIYVVKGKSPWYSIYWDNCHVINIDGHTSGKAIVTCDGNITSTKVMFAVCHDLTSIDLSSFDTSEVTTMGHMFEECNDLTKLNLSNFDTSKVTDMMWMFNNCYNLTTLDLSSFDTSKVKHMCAMFWGCNSLTTIKGVIDMKSCEYCGNMFLDCFKLKGVKIKNPPSDFEKYSGLSKSQYTIVS